jgi:hypothetical protein
MAIPRKTMRDIRTLSGRVDRIANPYMAYMQITCLEMEKVRKGRERESALQRMAVIDGRLRDIETEKAALVRALAAREAPPVAAASSLASRSAPARSAGGLTLRY